MTPETININARYSLAPAVTPMAEENAFDVHDRALSLQFKPSIVFANASEAECREWVLRNCEEPVEHTPGEWEFYAGHIYSGGEHGGNICSVSDPRASETVGYTPLGYSGENLKEAFANAALLKTAPKLLALLEQYHQSFPSKESGKLICEARNWTIQE